MGGPIRPGALASLQHAIGSRRCGSRALRLVNSTFGWSHLFDLARNLLSNGPSRTMVKQSDVGCNASGSLGDVGESRPLIVPDTGSYRRNWPVPLVRPLHLPFNIQSGVEVVDFEYLILQKDLLASLRP
jgi:hypothetical protein